MNNDKQFLSIEAFKIQASVLLKNLKSQDQSISADAIKRLRRVDDFEPLSDADIITTAKHKHALYAVAIDAGYESWEQLKAEFDSRLSLSFVENYQNGFLNHWFTNYDEAKSFQKKSGGFLFPYKNQIFVCNNDYISWLGFDVSDPDWSAIDKDWVKPKSYKAWGRLNQYWQTIKNKSKK